jgi:hypothetical protein
MTALPADLDFVADPTASPARMNRAMTNLNGRTAALETYKPNFDAALATIQQVGLDRLSQVLIPIYEQLVSVAQLGALFRAHSSSTLAVAAGPQTLVVDPAQASQFAAAAWVIAVSDDASAAMAGPVTSYNRTTGALVVDVVEGEGSGAFASWTISPWAPTQLSTGTDDGDIDHPGLTPVIAGYLSPEAVDAVADAEAAAVAAASSEAASAGSAGAAAADRATTATLLALFRAGFLGVFASDAAAAAFAAANSIALVAGVLYLSSATTTYRIYSGSAWGDYTASVVASVNGMVGSVVGVEVTANKGAANGYASLDSGGRVPTTQIPSGASIDDGAI